MGSIETENPKSGRVCMVSTRVLMAVLKITTNRGSPW